ncbi:MAG TPA: radical SAM/Cys-rich domain protein [Desulfobacterales bacterium]|nr:radical SAM/Cys-rich domain protein [Desulfobacterales bacterium]
MPEATVNFIPFAQTLEDKSLALRRAEAHTLQVNTGLLCNLSCRHCHLRAGPGRKEVMGRETVAAVIACARRLPFTVIDITGGAPEMNPYILELLAGLAPLTPRLILRSNLVAMSGRRREEIIALCRAHKVVIIASFPALNEAQAEAQRGEGVFARSLEILRCLNREGYGQAAGGLELNLVSNPAGAFVPSGQQAQERQFRQVLESKWGVSFNHLFTFANVPLGRFRDWLERRGNYDDYLLRLAQVFNEDSLSGVMCRSLISVDWNGFLYDCDFNQAADLPMGGVRRHINDLRRMPEAGEVIAVADHCYACTAGAGFT